MPPRLGSRYTFSFGVRDEMGRLFLTELEPFRFRELPDNRKHRVVEGDTLFHLAGRYFAPLPRACGYWWVIADFQPEPIVDPTLALGIGRVIHIPSVNALTEMLR